jgi:dTMP kinase
MLESFLKYQRLIGKEFQRMQKRYGIVPINGNRTVVEINSELQDRIIKAIDSNII